LVKLDARKESDALVLFGVTGDLAHKMIFPALLALVANDRLDVPVVGVASPKWSVDQLRAKVSESIQHSGTKNFEKVLPKLLKLIQFVSGDYRDANTYQVINSSNHCKY